MTNRQRDELRRLQDRFLALWSVKVFAVEHGRDHPLWQGGPSYLAVKLRLYSQWEAQFRWHLQQEAKS